MQKCHREEALMGRRSPILRPTRKEPLAKWPCFDPPHTGPLLPIHLLDFYYLLRHADRMTKSTWLIGQNRQDKRRDFFTHCERRASPILPLDKRNKARLSDSAQEGPTEFKLALWKGSRIHRCQEVFVHLLRWTRKGNVAMMKPQWWLTTTHLNTYGHY